MHRIELFPQSHPNRNLYIHFPSPLYIERLILQDITGELLKLLGKVSQTGKNKVIAKVSQLPKIGKKVFDDKENFVGTVTDFFGQTKEPYVVVTTKHPPAKYLGEQIYI